MSQPKSIVFLNETSADRHHGCTLVTQTIERLCAENGLSIVARSKVHEDWRGNADLQEIMGRADLILVNGEGTIHHDREAGRVLLEAGVWAAERGIPAALINATWQSNSPAFAHKLGSFALVSVRESASAAEVTRQGVACRVVPDLALWHEWPPVPARSGILVTDSVVPAVTTALDRLRSRVGGSALSMHFGQHGWRAHLGTLRRHGVGDTVSPTANVRGLLSARAERRSETTEVAEFMRRISACRLLVTGRFHAFILALAVRTPVLLAGSNTHKIAATLRDAGISQRRIVDPDSITPAMIESGAQWAPDEIEALDRFVSKGREAMWVLFQDLRHLAR